MPVANSVPRFVVDRRIAIGQVSAANTNRDGTGTIVTIASATAQGTVISMIRVVAVGTTTAGMVRIYIHDGANARLYHEFTVDPLTPSGTVAAYFEEHVPSIALELQTGYSIRASTHNAETFNVIVFCGDY